MNWSDKLRNARYAAKLSRARLSAAVGCDPSTVARVEAGKYPPNIVVFVKWAEACGVEPASLLPDGARRSRSVSAA